MSRAAVGASEAVATFVAGRHAGPEFDDALGTARARLIAALTALQTPTATSELASRALASYGTPLRRVFAEATTLAAAARGDAPIVAAALASSELAGRGETDVIEAIAVGREVAARLERALSLDAPWNATAVVAGIGAAAAAARAMGLDVDAARHAIGLAATIDQAIRLLPPGGTAVLVGMTPFGVRVAFDVFPFVDGSRSILGSNYGFAVAAVDFPRYAELFLAGRLPVDRLITIQSAECTGCLECVASCPAARALLMSAPGRRQVPAWAIATGVALLFIGIYGYARLTGHWDTNLSSQLYLDLIPHANEFTHP